MSDQSRREALRKLTEMAIEDGSYGELAPPMRSNEQCQIDAWVTLHQIALHRISRAYIYLSLIHDEECTAENGRLYGKCRACKVEQQLAPTSEELKEISRVTAITQNQA